MKNKIFIDGGFHLGEGLSEFKQILRIDDDWDIHVFEPNKYCNSDFINENLTYYKKAIWIEDGEQLFNCEDNNVSNSPKINSGSNLDGWGSCLTTIDSKHSYNDQILVETIDFSKFIEQFEGSEVYCKLDIEGAEFSVLRRLIETGKISIIKELWVEWHEMDLPNENENTRDELIAQVSLFTKINNWK